MDERKRTGHRVSLEERERLFITGVTEVEEFNEDGITVMTEMGMMLIKGEGLRVARLDTLTGELDIEGEIASLEYSDRGLGRGAASVWSRIFK